MTRVDRTISLARDIRANLLRYDDAPRDLAGQCGLASMLVAVALKDPHALRTGFYMKYETLFGKRGRFPHRHAWCRVGSTIVDATATQFDRRNRSVHVVHHAEDDRYIESASGRDAIDDIMNNWCGRALLVYRQLAKDLRRWA